MAFLFLYFCFSTITPLKHTHTHVHTRDWACCFSEIQSVAPLCADVSKNPILLLHCASGDRGPSLRAQGHRTRRHKEPYLLLSVRMCKCALSLYLPIFPCLSLSRAHARTRAHPHSGSPPQWQRLALIHSLCKP